MATLNGTSLLPPAFNQPEAGKVGYLLCTYTGAANDSQQLVTSATFTVAAVGSNQTVTFAAPPVGNILAAGNLIQIADGTHIIIGTVVSGGNTTSVVVKTVAITGGSSGNTMGSAANVYQVTSASFTLGAATVLNAIPMTDATQAALFAPGDALSISDGTNTFTASVVSVAGSTINATTTAISAGTAGNTVASNAYVQSTSGDRIVFNQDPLNFMPSGAIPLESELRMPGSTSGQTNSIGYVSKDLDVTTANATNYTYFSSAQAAATAGVYRNSSANAPIGLPKSAWVTLTLPGATAPSATYTVIVKFAYPGPLAANR